MKRTDVNNHTSNSVYSIGWVSFDMFLEEMLDIYQLRTYLGCPTSSKIKKNVSLWLQVTLDLSKKSLSRIRARITSFDFQKFWTCLLKEAFFRNDWPFPKNTFLKWPWNHTDKKHMGPCIYGFYMDLYRLEHLPIEFVNFINHEIISIW